MSSSASKLIPVAAAVITAWTATACGHGSSAPAAHTVTVDESVTYQQISGFGISEAFGQAVTVRDAAPTARKRILDDLFSATRGAGLTILRNEISADPGDTIEPAAPPSPAATPKYLPLPAVGSDQGQLWLAQAIKADYGVTNVVADAWSAPAFMKTNHSVTHGGTLCGVPGTKCPSGDWRQAYADYLRQYAADYAAAGVPLSYIGPENEADYAPQNYDGMTLTPAQNTSLLDILGPAMAASALPTKVECCSAYGWDYARNEASAIEADPVAGKYVTVFTSHGYHAPVTGALPGWNKPAWETEWSTFESWDPSWDDDSPASGFTWAEHIFAGLDSANLSAFLYWWGSSTPQNNGDNESLVQVDGDTVTPSGRLWAFANFSRFVRPGAHRIAATTADRGLTVDAFRDADGSVAAVALNAGTTPDTVTFEIKGTGLPNGTVATPYLTNDTNEVAAQKPLQVSGGIFTWTVPARSLVTFQIHA